MEGSIETVDMFSVCNVESKLLDKVSFEIPDWIGVNLGVRRLVCAVADSAHPAAKSSAANWRSRMVLFLSSRSK